ncbi:MAG: hypothetical protein DRO39_04035 [Thermoprotei archaeon]|nr:MAG: hypothetical protein DRO39_04035 [Thermoprotei archaeon]
MAIRIRLRVKSRHKPSRELTTVALVNSGFEADTPQILLPAKLARELNLYSRLGKARIESYGTVAGPIRMYVLPSSVEVLISDYLAGELRIVAEDFRYGYWRLRTDPAEKRRQLPAPEMGLAQPRSSEI